MDKKEPKPVHLHDWPNYIVTEYLELSEQKAYTLELLMSGRTNAISTTSHPVVDKAMDNCTKEGISTLLGLYALSLGVKHPTTLDTSFKKDSALLITRLRNGTGVESDEEIICGLILNSLQDVGLKTSALQRVLTGENPSGIIHSILDDF